MNIAKKTPQEILDTEITDLRRTVEARAQRELISLHDDITRRTADIKSALALEADWNRNMFDGAEFVAVKDKTIPGVMGDGAVSIVLHNRNVQINMHEPAQPAMEWNNQRQRYRFVLLAYRLPDEAP